MPAAADRVLSRAASPRSSDARGRTLHLVDIENLAGGPHQPVEVHCATYQAYEQHAGIRDGDQVVIAACGRVMSSLAFRLPKGICRHVGKGRDGADRILLAAGTPHWIAERFARLVIGSGDHAFVELAVATQALGAQVAIVSGLGRRSVQFLGHGLSLSELPSQAFLGAE